ncbi:iron chaperone [Dactylosporangium sp. NPDC051541]|uniref:iron chaperone n=1 Tax=Dactylosporangium sp. NPDC051541 TaxID=3363977 RepID=UPI003797EE7D
MAPKKRTGSASASTPAFNAEERAAMQEHVAEVRASARRGSKADKAAEDLQAMLDKIAEMEPADRATAERIHALVTEAAPDLTAKLWYGMPAYYKGTKSICFFQPATKFKTRYSTLGFNQDAALDDGDLWPVAYAVNKLTKDVEARITTLVKQAAS